MMRPTMLALALAPTLLVTAAAAQPAPPRGPHGAPQAEMKAHHEAMKKQHMEDLKTVLRLRPDQEAALAAFAASHEPKTFERRLPNHADSVRIDDASHFLQDDVPERVTETIRHFVADTPVAVAGKLRSVSFGGQP